MCLLCDIKNEEEDKLRLDHDDISSTMTSVYFVLFFAAAAAWFGLAILCCLG